MKQARVSPTAARAAPAGLLAGLAVLTVTAPAVGLPVLPPDAYTRHVQRFNAMEDEHVTNAVANARAWSWLEANIPLFGVFLTYVPGQHADGQPIASAANLQRITTKLP